MSDLATYASAARRRDLHAEYIHSGRAVFVLGAGVSQSAGLPSWKALLESIGTLLGDSIGSDEDGTRFAERMKASAARMGRSWREVIHSAVYQNVEISPLSLVRAPTLSAVTTLVAKLSAMPGGSDVITFNYDDLLEKSLRLLGQSCSSIDDPQDWYTPSNVRVWHPHGFLPLDDKGDVEKNLVLDRYSFALAASEAGTVWNAVLRGLMRRRYVFFVGVSGDDPNLDRFLLDCAHMHATGPAGKYWGTAFLVSPTPDMANTWASRKVFVETCDDFSVDLPSKLLALAEAAR